MFFQFPLEQVTEVIVLRKGLLNVQKTNSEQMLKMFNFLEFSSSYKNVVNFCDFNYFFSIK